ncbi:MAG: hypothetical protein GX631_10085 [Dehalococcoidales bacterium]|nr:hypothetical protein [Dehalococcoidales bacterium]
MMNNRHSENRESGRILPFLKQMNLTVRFNRRIQLPTEGVLRYAQNPNAVFEKIKRDIDSSS